MSILLPLGQLMSLWASGLPFDELDLHYLRQQTGVLLQDPLIFAGTVCMFIVTHSLALADQVEHVYRLRHGRVVTAEHTQLLTADGAQVPDPPLPMTQAALSRGKICEA